MLWVNVLHIYQPVTQSEDIIHRVVKECYGPLVDGLGKTPSARITLNCPAVLTEWLVNLGYAGIVEGLTEAAKRGQVEFMTTAKYHAILPLIPLPEVRRQLRLNLETNRRLFGPVYQPIGVFLPEMAYSPEVGRLIAEMGYKYVVIDEIGYQSSAISHQSSDRKLPSYDRLYTLRDRPELTIFFRSRGASDAISFGKIRTAEGFIQAIQSRVGETDVYVITAMDGETFGHHRRGFDRVLFASYEKSQALGLTPVLLKELGKGIRGIKGVKGEEDREREEVEPVACNWSARREDLEKGISFALWKYPDNPVHRWQWALADLALRAISENNPITQSANNPIKENREEARGLLDKALHSDQFWWASAYRLKGSGFVFWSRVMIERGAELFLEAIASIPQISDETKAQARDLYVAVNESAASWEKELRLGSHG